MSKRWLLPAAILLSLGLLLPALSAPRYVDDFYIHARVAGSFGAPTTLGAYEFFWTEAQIKELVRIGVLPWWTSSGLELRFFRPLTSLTHAFDVALLGARPIWARLHSFVWMAALLVVASRLFRRWLQPGAASLAIVLYAIAGHHALSAVWIAARHALISGVFGLLALLSWLAWREDGRRGAWALWCAFTLLALCGGEVGLGVPILCASHALLARRERAFGARAADALPALAVLGLYLGAYALAGYGAQNSAGYVDPVAAPLEFLRVGIGRFLTMIGQLVHGIPSEFHLAARARPVLWVAAIVALGVLGFAVRKLGLSELETHPGWLVVGSVLAVLPAGAAVPGGRALVLAAPGFTAIVAAVLWRARQRPPASALAALALLAFGQVVVSALGRLMLANALLDGASKEAQIAARWTAPCAADELRVLLTAPDFAAGAYAGLQLSLTRGEPIERFRLASMAPIDVKLSRSGERSVRLEAAPGTAFFQSQWEQLHSPHPPRVGDSGRYDGLELRVAAADADARPTVIELTTDAPLADQCWLRWQGGTFTRLEPPAEGGSISIPTEPGPLALPSYAE